MAEPASAFQASRETTPSSDPGSVAGKAWSGNVATVILLDWSHAKLQRCAFSVCSNKQKKSCMVMPIQHQGRVTRDSPAPAHSCRCLALLRRGPPIRFDPSGGAAAERG